MGLHTEFLITVGVMFFAIISAFLAVASFTAGLMEAFLVFSALLAFDIVLCIWYIHDLLKEMDKFEKEKRNE